MNDILNIFKPLEIILKKTIIGLISMLLISQLLLIHPSTRMYISQVDRLEGRVIENAEIVPASKQVTQSQWIEFSLLDSPRKEIIILVDDVVVGTFQKDTQRVLINNNQTLSIIPKGIPGIYNIQVNDSSGIEHNILVPGRVLEVSVDKPFITSLY
ncbi:hypothetical protein BHU72_08040 [Desulfuribacillus stibiiarsenatis]|uniref:Uncharacterized protein n=1 Tax=Desulfuribacillus stibiiarsenatis TaxID=1390249 RepID=A0A1E5L3V5_9FIRM|nr:hypothetical protein [Desulfuribacillus stibiiarsenatis]OEH84774.1 hypothetical protein BHU72_08040 [Desulfuribacillus stibiiarsenatis]